MLIGGEKDLEALRAQIPVLAAKGLNTIVVEVDYNYQFRRRPEMFDPSGVTLAGARRFSATCRRVGVNVIPEIDCLGHQSWASATGALLTRHPELDETPGQYPNNQGIYCRSWCPLHPDLPTIVYPLIDELVDAFQASSFHCGLDEVFIIGSPFCTRCHGLDPALLFAKQVKSLYYHLLLHRVQMLMWSDRLLNASLTGYGEWEASANGTDPAIDLVPKGILLCDWHYEYRDSYPSLGIFLSHGFSVWPCTWNDANAASTFSSDAQTMNQWRIVGALSSTWGAVNASQLSAWPPFLATLEPWLN